MKIKINIIEEKLTVCNKSNDVIKRQTKQIASMINRPFVNDMFGFRINTMNHIMDSYSLNYFNSLKQK